MSEYKNNLLEIHAVLDKYIAAKKRLMHINTIFVVVCCIAICIHYKRYQEVAKVNESNKELIELISDNNELYRGMTVRLDSLISE